MTEDQLFRKIAEMCRERGHLFFHAHDSRRDHGTGFPDLVIAGIGGALFRELKSDDGELSVGQKIWRYRLQAGGADWGLWRPAHWRSGQIEKELDSIR